MSSPRWKRLIPRGRAPAPPAERSPLRTTRFRSWAVGLAAAGAVVVLIVVTRDRWVAWFAGDAAAHAASSGAVIYTCPMDPSVEAHAPSKCPLCGMDLTPVTRAARTGQLYLDPDSAKRAGIQLAAAEQRTLRRRITAFGAVLDATPPEAPHLVVAPVYGDDALAVSPGAVIGAVAPALPLARFTGTVLELRPSADDASALVRADLADPGTLLRTGMTIELQLDVDLTDRLVVPARAIMYAGERRLAFVERAHGGLELRELTIGARVGDHVEVQLGLAAGERVVVAGTFLAAAESRIRGSSPLWDDRPVLAKTRTEKAKRTAAGIQIDQRREPGAIAPPAAPPTQPVPASGRPGGGPGGAQ